MNATQQNVLVLVLSLGIAGVFAILVGVLSSQSLAGLDVPGARNVVRNELITQFNRTLGGEVIEQIYFSEFVVQ